MEENKFGEICRNLIMQIKCTKPDHNEEDLSIICLKPSCEQKRLMCLKLQGKSDKFHRKKDEDQNPGVFPKAQRYFEF